MESPAKKRGQTNKGKKKQNTKKSTSNTKQANPSKGSSNQRNADLSNGNTSRDKPTASAHLPRNMNALLNAPYGATLGNSMAVPAVSISSANSSVYGYGGLPTAPPISGNSSSFMPASSHIPPAQRAGPYIPYYPQASKPS